MHRSIKATKCLSARIEFQFWGRKKKSKRRLLQSSHLKMLLSARQRNIFLPPSQEEVTKLTCGGNKLRLFLLSSFQFDNSTAWAHFLPLQALVLLTLLFIKSLSFSLISYLSLSYSLFFSLSLSFPIFLSTRRRTRKRNIKEINTPDALEGTGRIAW